MNGVPVARAPGAAPSHAGRTPGSARAIGSMNDMASVEPEASAATWDNVAVIASLVRYMLTPVEATTAGLLKSKPDAVSRSHQASPASKSTGTNLKYEGIPK